MKPSPEKCLKDKDGPDSLCPALGLKQSRAKYRRVPVDSVAQPLLQGSGGETTDLELEDFHIQAAFHHAGLDPSISKTRINPRAEII